MNKHLVLNNLMKFSANDAERMDATQNQKAAPKKQIQENRPVDKTEDIQKTKK